MNGVYYLNAIYLDGLQDVYYWPIFLDDVPADNDPRKIFLGGLLLQRPSLAMVGNILYAGFGGMCDAFNYTGVLVAVNVDTQKVNRWVTQGGPNSAYTDDWTLWHGGGAGGIWQAGMGLASDGQDVFFTVDNGGGSTDTNISTKAISGKMPMDIVSESVVRVNANDSGVQLQDWFRPFDYQSDQGEDIGSGGVSILDSSLFKTDKVKRMAVAASKNFKMYITDLDNLGGYREGKNGTDAVLQTIPLDGEVYGGIGSYPLEGGYVYVNPAGAPLSAYRFSSSNSTSSGPLFSLAGRSSISSPHARGVGIPTVTSRNSTAGSGIVWVTDAEKGLLAYKAVPVNGTLMEIPLPKVEGAMMYSRPVFGDGRVYVFDAKDKLIALGVK